MNRKTTQRSSHPGPALRKNSGQAVIEIAIFGAVVIFLMGVLIRTHLSTTQNQDHQIRAMKMALQASNKNSLGIGPNGSPIPANSSRNSATILFIEDRLSPDFNKYNTIDRTTFTAQGSGIMSNRLEYPIDFVGYENQPFGEIGYNLPVMDVYINGQHFPMTLGAYVFRILYTKTEKCPDDLMGLSLEHGPEYGRCFRQQAETDGAGNHNFFGITVNGTTQYNPTAANANFDLFRNDYSSFPSNAIASGQNRYDDDVKGCPGASATASNSADCRSFTWQWRFIPATSASFSQPIPEKPTDVFLGFGTEDSPNYPSMDTSGSLKEQSIYAVSTKDLTAILNDPKLRAYQINGNPHLLSLTQTLLNDGPGMGYNFNNNKTLPNPNPLGLTRSPAGTITAVAILDPQLGDLDLAYDPRTSVGPVPGLMRETAIFSQVRPGTYLEVKEGKLYNPETKQVVRSISSKDHVDLISRSFQLSNNTGRFCMITQNGSYYRPAKLIDQTNEDNPVQACSDDCWGENATKTCYSPKSRILFVRTVVGEKNTRKWFTDVTKGL